MHIAVADDDPELLERLSEALREAGHDFDSFSEGLTLMRSLRRQTYDVVLLDWNMPGASGYDIVREAIETLQAPPAFILLTSRSAPEDIVDALRAGASDYIVKPESRRVIVARIEAAYRQRNPPRKTSREEYGEFVIDHQAEKIFRAGEHLALTTKEFALATLFFANIDRPLSREFLSRRVWGTSSDIQSRTLDVHVSRIRIKLGLRPENGFALKTVFAFGYRLDSYMQEDGQQLSGAGGDERT